MIFDQRSRTIRTLTAIAILCAAVFMTGCGSGSGSDSGQSGGGGSTPPLVVGPKGSVYGGQQPIAGATIHLYAAGTAAYGSATADLLTGVTTDATGAFAIAGKYTCTTGQQMYLVALGGNTGTGVNPNSALMAALGDCSTLNADTIVTINELTTVASVYALAPFMASYSAVGSSQANATGLAHAFSNVTKLVNLTTGQAGGPTLPAGATLPTSKLNTLAAVLAACVDTTGGAAGDGTICGKLFANAAPSGRTPPSNTIDLALALAKNPALNVAATFALASTGTPFSPQLSTAPADWTLSIQYSTGLMNAPKSTTIDAAGNIWIANSGNNTVTVLAQTGAPISGSPFTGNGLKAPASIAIDANGTAWVANAGGSSVSAFTATGASMTGSPFTGSGTILSPGSIAIDGPGNIWIANTGGNSITELSATGAYVQQVSNGTDAPQSIAVDPK